MTVSVQRLDHAAHLLGQVPLPATSIIGAELDGKLVLTAIANSLQSCLLQI